MTGKLFLTKTFLQALTAHFLLKLNAKGLQELYHWHLT